MFLCCLLQAAFLPAQPDASQPDRVLAALQDGAHYAAAVLLDEEGKSRCDYNLTEGRWYPYEEPWHTGQVIYGLLEAHRVTGEESYLKAARRAGDWWISLEIKDHPKLKGMLQAIHGDHAGQVIVFATVSDGTPGLFELTEVTGDRRYAETATRAGRWMLEHMCDLEAGLCYDNVDPETGEVFTQSSPFHPDKEAPTLLDVARPNNEGALFLDMYRFTEEPRYRDAFLTLCNSLVERQDEHGLWMDFMPNHPDVGTFHPRFNLWYAESLLDGYDLTGDRRYLAAARRTVMRYLEAQRSDGTIYYKNYLNGEADRSSICGSAVSFTGLLLLRLLEHGAVDDSYRERVDRCAEWVLRNRYAADHPDPNLRGAFMNIRLRHRKGKHWLVNRDVGTAFGLRFLAAYHDYLTR